MPTTASGTISNNNVAITPTQTVQSKMERYSFFTLSKFFAPILYPINGLAAENDAHDDIDHNGKNFAFDPDNGNRNINAVFRRRSVFRKHHIAN